MSRIGRITTNMEIPFLKNKRNEGGGGSTTHIKRTSDTTQPQVLLEGIADELLQAIEKKDFGGIKSALRAFISMINEQDTAQDKKETA